MKKFTDKINESVEDTIPTAEDVLVRIMSSLKMDYSIDELNEIDPDLVSYLVEELKAASEKARLTDFAYEFLQEGAYDAIDKESILNAYPLDNIK